MRHLNVSWRKVPVVLLVVGCQLFGVEVLKFENWGKRVGCVGVGNCQPQGLRKLAVTIHRRSRTPATRNRTALITYHNISVIGVNLGLLF